MMESEHAEPIVPEYTDAWAVSLPKLYLALQGAFLSGEMNS